MKDETDFQVSKKFMNYKVYFAETKKFKKRMTG